MRQYATTADLTAEYPDTAQPANVETLLSVASACVDKMLKGVPYDTDADLLPTDTDVAEAMKLATCAIVAEWVAVAATVPGSSQQWESVAIGSVSLSTLQGASDSDAQRIDGFPIPALAITLLGAVGPVQVWRCS
jgi:hypothetical protein